MGTKESSAALLVLVLMTGASFGMCRPTNTAAGQLMHIPSTAPSTSRKLQQADLCPAGCTAGGCRLSSTSGGFYCAKCHGALLLDTDRGSCKCPAGRHGGNDTCIDCGRGSYCPGGAYTGPNTPTAIRCGEGLTTPGRRATSSKQCVLAEGYYVKNPGETAVCPRGEYKSGFNSTSSCTKCAWGVTTRDVGSTSASDCREVLPTFAPVAMQDSTITTAVKCPQKYYCPGGPVTRAFNSSEPTNLNGTTLVLCPDETWTVDVGASTRDQCLTPPGFKTSNGRTTPCEDGEYRAEWRPATLAGACDSCGTNISSAAMDQIAQYSLNITAAADAVSLDVRGSAASCYIKAGQGMYFSPATNRYIAVNCDNNNFGVPNITAGLGANPCRDCPAGMQTSTALNASAAFWASDGAGKQGFTSLLACVTQPGFGFNGRIATRCPPGSYNPPGVYGPCTTCAAGFSTPDNSSRQVSADDCTVAVGYGFHGGSIVECPLGTYNSELRSSKTAPCTPCPPGLTTFQAGGRSIDDCSVCMAGYGGDACSTRCGGGRGANATYGPAGSSQGTACQLCPAITNGFSFFYEQSQNIYIPGVVSRAGAESPADCLAEFAQIADAAWHMGGSVALTKVPGVSTFEGCVEDCKTDTACQYVTFDYQGSPAADNVTVNADCYKKTANSSAVRGQVVAYKTLLSHAPGAAAVSVEAKGLASGFYTAWNDIGDGIGETQTAIAAATIEDCLMACTRDASCAGVSIVAVFDASPTLTSCKVIKGSTALTSMRSMIKVVAARLTTANATETFLVG